MKIRPQRLLAGLNRRSDGSATVLYVALLAIMLILVTAEGRALFALHLEVKLLEQQQVKRLGNPPVPPAPISKPTNP